MPSPEQLLHFIDSGDVCSLVFVAIVLAWIGQVMVYDRPDLHWWGARLAGGVFILYGVSALAAGESVNGPVLVGILLKALLAGGLTLGLSWIALAVGAFFFRYLERVAKAIRHRTLDVVQSHRLQKQRERQQRAAEERRRREQEERERTAPERERRRQEEEARRQAEEAARRKAQKRRDEARLACQLLYDQHAAELADRFPRDRLDAYFQQYLSDDQPPEEVEQRAELLKAMIRQSLGTPSGRGKRFDSPKEIAEHFDQQRREVEQLDCDPETKDTILSTINDQEEQAIMRLYTS